jgi:hypothetical protein
MNAVISIGRNVRDSELSDVDWDAFIRSTKGLVDETNNDGNVHYFGTGEGVYLGETEESFTIVYTVDENDLDYLRTGLTMLAHAYDQESIALTLGEVEFLG